MRKHAPALVLLPLAALFIAVVATVYARFAPSAGLDYQGNLNYLRYLDFTARIPLATRGWQMYHPPLFHATSALLFEALHRPGGTLTLTDAGRWVATAAWGLEGVAAIAAVRAWNGSWLGASAAAAIVWLLPGQAMVGGMVYNETLTGLGVAIIVLGLALWQRSPGWSVALLALGIPVAALSKYSGLAAVAAAALFIIWQVRHRLRPALLALIPGAVLVAAFYARNLIALGTPLPLNAVIFDLQSWDPVGWGHPAGFFTRIDLGVCAAKVSFWGGFWKWFFGSDCLPLPPWRGTLSPLLLAAGMLVTVVLLAAFAWLVIDGRADPARLVLVAIPVVVFVAFVLYILRVPSATTDKGVYTLAAIVPAATAVGLFSSRWVRGRPASAAAYLAILAWGVVMAHATGLA